MSQVSVMGRHHKTPPTVSLIGVELPLDEVDLGIMLIAFGFSCKPDAGEVSMHEVVEAALDGTLDQELEQPGWARAKARLECHRGDLRSVARHLRRHRML